MRGESGVSVKSDGCPGATPNIDSEGLLRRGGIKYDQDEDRKVKTWWDKPSKGAGWGR